MKIMSINFNHALFSLSDSLTVEDGTSRLSCNVSNKLLLYTAWYPRRVQITLDDAGLGLAVHGLAHRDPVGRGLVWRFIRKFKVTSHI